MQKIALIPAYCPNNRMIDLVNELHQRNFSVVVIDDGSGSEYDAIFDAVTVCAEVKRYQPNRGKGEALKYGLRYIDRHFQPPYTVVTADADGQHRIEDIVKVSETATVHPDSLILGKRLLDRKAPIKSRIGNGISRVLFRLVTGRNIYETQTGLRAFSDQLLPSFLKLPGHRYEYEIDMMLAASDTPIIEVDIKTVYFDNNSESHFRPIEDTISLDKEFFRYKIPSLISGAAGLILFIILSLSTETWLFPCIASRLLTIIVKYVLNLIIPFSEKVPLPRYVITSLIILFCDFVVIGTLCVIGADRIFAKIVSCVLMIGVSIVVRMFYMRRKYK